MSNEKHTIRNSVISGLIVLAIGGTVPFVLPDAWNRIKATASSFFAWLSSTMTVPVWLVGVLVLASLFAACVIAWWGHVRLRIPWRGYTEDRFLDVMWRWKYRFGKIDLETLKPYCRTDDTELAFVPQRYVPSTFDIALRCDSCRNTFYHQEVSELSFREKVLRLIEQRIRSGEWKDVVAKARGKRG